MGKRRHKTNITAERLRMRSCVLPGLVFPFFRSLSENTLPAVVNACVQGKPQTQVAARGHLKPASRQRPQIAGVKSRRASGGPALPGGGSAKDRDEQEQNARNVVRKSVLERQIYLRSSHVMAQAPARKEATGR